MTLANLERLIHDDTYMLVGVHQCWWRFCLFYRRFPRLNRDDLALPEERRRRMFEAEAKVVLSEERDAAVAKSSLEVR